MTQDEPKEVSVSFELQLTPRECEWLSRLFGVGSDFAGSFEDLIHRLARSATYEWLDQFLERADLGGRVDMQQRRLLRLSTDLFDHRLPSSSRVAQLFRVTPRQAETMINNTVSRFASELEGARRSSIASELDNLVEEVPNTEEAEGRYRITFADPGDAAYLRRLLREAPGRSRKVESDRADNAVYLIYDSALVALAPALDLDVAALRERAAANSRQRSP